MRSPILGWIHPDHGADQRARGAALSAAAPGVTHAPDFFFVEDGKLVFFGLQAKAQFVVVVDDAAQRVAAANLVLDLTKNLANLVFDGVRPAGTLLEALQVGEEVVVNELNEVIAGQRLVVVGLVRGVPGRGLVFPATGHVQDGAVQLALQRGFRRFVQCSRASRHFKKSSQEVCSV